MTGRTPVLPGRSAGRSLDGGPFGAGFPSVASAPADAVGIDRVGLGSRADQWMEIAMHRIAQANIEKFELLLETENEQIKRAMILRLLKEEREKLRAATRSHEAGAKAAY
jgi:hypothetical protein